METVTAAPKSQKSSIRFETWVTLRREYKTIPTETVRMNRNGQATTELVLALSFLSPALVMVFVFILFLLAHSFLWADCYFLARSHIYQNNTNSCRPSSLWPTSAYFELN